MEQMRLQNQKILVVEDSRTQLKLVTEYLESKGGMVLTALDGSEGYQKAKNERPDIIITDIEMPKMNGYDLCRMVKDDVELNAIPVILLTNLSDPMDVIKGIECGADTFLTKPCSENRLIESVEDSLANAKFARRKSPSSEIEFSYSGMRHKLKVDQNQIIDLLLSTYANAMEKNSELERTNRKLSALHHELQQKNEELTKLVDDKNILLGMAAHDLRNPLNTIQNYSALLQMKLPESIDEGILRMIKTIARSSKFMLMLVNDLLSISIVEAGKLKLDIQKINLLELVKNNCKINESLAEQKEIKLIFTYDASIPEIYLDPNKIEQVLNNLIHNAIKYSHPGSSIYVFLKKEPKKVLLKVKDEGIGIPEEETHHLFEIFRTGTKMGTSGEPSTGLGLAIVKRIVDAHCGEIWVDSALGKGTTFSVTLPLAMLPTDYAINVKSQSTKIT